MEKHHLLISKKGFFEVYYTYFKKPNSNKTFIKKSKRKVSDRKIFTVLKDNCVIEKNFTVRNLFALVEKHPILKVFISQYVGFDIDNYHTLIHKKFKGKSPCHRIIIQYIADRFSFKNEISLNCCWESYGESPKEHYGLALPKYYMDVPIEIAKKSVFCDLKDVEDLSSESSRIEIDTPNISLLDFLDSLYSEISDFGNLQETQEILQSLKTRLRKL